MTKDEALLLTAAAARGLVTLTSVEAAEIDAVLAMAADDLRRLLATEKVAAAQRRIASVSPDSPCGLEDDADALKMALVYQREVADATSADRTLPARVSARGAIAAKPKPFIEAFLAAAPTGDA